MMDSVEQALSYNQGKIRLKKNCCVFNNTSKLIIEIHFFCESNDK